MGVHPTSSVTLDGWTTDVIPKLQKSTYVLSLGHVHLPSDGCIHLLLSDALCSLPASSLGRVMLVCHVHQAGRLDYAFLCWFPLLYSPFQRFKIKSQAVHRSMKTTLKSWVIVFVCLFVCFFLFNPPCPPKLLPLLKAQSCPLLRISKMNILLLYLNTLHRSISVADKIGITGLSKMWGSATGWGTALAEKTRLL